MGLEGYGFVARLSPDVAWNLIIVGTKYVLINFYFESLAAIAHAIAMFLAQCA